MNIVVYCGANQGLDFAFTESTRELGAAIGDNGHSLVFGASDCGLMGEISRAVMEHGGETIGVVPTGIQFIADLCNPNLTRRIDTDSLAERKTMMIEMGEAYVALPGGLGTLDEVTEIMELCKIGEQKPVVLMNIKGYYDDLKRMLDTMIKQDFVGKDELPFVCFANDAKEAIDFIEQWYEN